MKFWIDAQLPAALAGWLTQRHGVEASTLHALGLRHADDADIWNTLRSSGQVIVSKDEDFVDLATRTGPPPQVLWVTCGNVTNRALVELFERAFPEAKRLLESGEPVVELTSA